MPLSWICASSSSRTRQRSTFLLRQVGRCRACSLLTTVDSCYSYSAGSLCAYGWEERLAGVQRASKLDREGQLKGAGAVVLLSWVPKICKALRLHAAHGATGGEVK